VWDAWAGVENHWVTLYPMYPAHLKIKKGQNVRFHFDSLIYETHTVSLPQPKALEAVSRDFIPQCDPDGDSGAGPDTNPTSPPDQFPACPEGSELELEAAAEITTPAGDGVYTGGNDFENSAIRGVLAGNYTSMTVRFTKATGSKPLKYICLIHPFMVGKITVK
jgi:plastocyanin